MNLLAFIGAVACAVVALFYALPMLAMGFVARFLRRRFGISPPIFMLAAFRLRWMPVLVWGGASLLLFWIAFAA